MTTAKINFKKIILRALPVSLVALSLILISLHLVLDRFVTNPEATTANIFLFSNLSYIFYGIAIVLTAWFVSKEITISYLYKLAGSYTLYLIGSYFLTITQNLNNKDFVVLELGTNGFFQTNFLSTLFYIIFIAIGIRLLTDQLKKRRRTLSNFSARTTVTLHELMAAVILADSLSYSVIFRLYNQFQIVGLFSFVSQLLIYITSLFILYSLLSYFIIQGLADLFCNKPSLSLAVGSSFFFGIIFNYLLQYGVKKDAALMDMFIYPAATAYQILLIFILSLLVYLLFNRYLFSSILIVSFWTTISIVNIIKMEMRNEPMLFTDFSWVKQINLVMSFVDSSTVLYLIVGLVVATLLYLFLYKRLLPGKVISNIKIRSLYIVVILSLLSTCFAIFRNEKNRNIVDGVPILSQLNNNYNTFWLDLSYHARYRSLLFVWTKQLTAEAVERPSDYSRERMEEIANKYQNLAHEINQTRTAYLNDQTVIFILSESYADPQRLQGITISQDIMPNIRDIMTAHTSGTMHSDGYGGGTANMEWQSLVGLPMYNMSESISTLNTEVVPIMSYIPSISDLFDRENRIAVHLGDAATYSRNNFYENKLEFSEFYAGKNGTTTVDDFYRLGLFPSDASTYKTILDVIDSSKNQFFSVISYQNHIPYSQAEPAHLIATGSGLSQDENSSLTSYSRLMYNTDLETRAFLDSLSRLDNKVTVVFYGDHLPGFYPSSQFESNPESQYETDYFIWSNYQTAKHSYDYVNSSDFPAAVLAHTNSKVSPYYALLTAILEESNIGNNNMSEEQKVIADELILVEYDIISGSGYLNEMDTFFEIAN